LNHKVYLIPVVGQTDPLPTRFDEPTVASSFRRENIYIVSMSASRKKFSRGSARVIKSRTVFQGPVFKVVSQQVKEPDGVRVRRDIVCHPGSIVILALDEDRTRRPPRVLLERQYRHAAGQRLWELPAGSLEPGENKLAAAKRELLEETGFTARKWQRALSFYVSPGFLTESMDVFLARQLAKGKAQPEEDERISVRFFPLPQAVKMAMSGKIKDAKTLASLFWLENKRARR
jgi:ADP-ribose pyrophosphatase